jgi:hypothetical protein
VPVLSPKKQHVSTVVVTLRTENALILGDPWFRQFVIFHDLRHHEVTDKTINVSCSFIAAFTLLPRVTLAEQLCMCFPVAT